MDEPTTKQQFPRCPNCGSDRVHRSLRRGPQDFVRHNLLFQSPYRCEACDERFFGFRVPHHPKKDAHRSHPA